MATLDELTVRIKADASQFDREINRVGNSAGRVTSAFGGLKTQFLALGGAVAAVKLVDFARDAIDTAGALQDMADRVGTSAEFLSAMDVQARQTGATMQDVGQAVQFMNNSIGEAAKGNAAMVESFQRLNIDLEQLKQLSPEEQFYLIAQRISELGTQFEQTEAARNIFGRGVGNLLPLLKQGGDDLRAMNDELVKTGQALSDENISALDEFGDALSRMATIAKNEVVGAMAEALIAIQRLTGSLSLMGSEAVRRTIGDVQAEIAKREKSIGALEGRTGGMAESSLRIERQKLQEARQELQQLQNAYSSGKEAFGPAMGGTTKKATPAEASALRKQATKEIKDMAQETDGLSQSMAKVEDQSVVSARLIKDSFGDALESAAFDFENFGDSVSRVLDGIARDIARRAFIGPLSSGVSDWLMGSGSGLPWDQGVLGGLFSGLGFADGGRPPVGKASVVGERGPELFIPDTAGTIVPNGASMGGGVSIVNHWSFQSGVTRQELAALIPVIEARSTAATLAAVERGGRASQIVGKRN